MREHKQHEEKKKKKTKKIWKRTGVVVVFSNEEVMVRANEVSREWRRKRGWVKKRNRAKKRNVFSY
jgi:uncharacterized protein YacL (UPF0231 family)